MQYLKQTIVYLSEQNKQLKEKVRKLESICKNLTSASLLNPSYSNQLDQWQLTSPNKSQSTKNQSFKPTNNSQTNPSIQSTTSNHSLHHKFSTALLQQQIFSLKQQVQSLTQQLHQNQLQSLNKSTKVKQLNSQLSRCKQEVIYLRKQASIQKENLKMFYQTVLVKQMEQKFSQQKINYEKEWKRQKEQLEQEIRKSTILIQSQQYNLQQTQKQLLQKTSKQQRILTLLRQMKQLMHSSQQQHNQQLTQLTTQISSFKSEITHLQSTISTLTQQLQKKQHQSDLFQLQLKKLTHQLHFLKRQHQRSLSKTQRQLQRQRSFSKSLQKNFIMEKKSICAELKKIRESQKYHLRKEKLLIGKIRQNEANNNNSFGVTINGISSQLTSLNSTQLLMMSNHQSLSTLDLTLTTNQHKSPSSINNKSNLLQQNKPSSSFSPYAQSSKHSFTKFLQHTPSTSQANDNQLISINNHKKQKEQQLKSKSNKHDNVTPKSIVKLKSNTIGVINKTNNTSKINNKSISINSSRTTNNTHDHSSFTKTTIKHSTPSTSREQFNNNSKSNLKSVNLKDTKYHNQPTVVTQFSLTPQNSINNTIHSPNQTIQHHNTLSPSQYYKKSLLLEQQQQINNYSSISLTKDNPNYFPSSKTSKTNSSQKPSEFSQFRSNQQKHSFDHEIQQLRKLEQYMRTSFNPNHNNNLMKEGYYYEMDGNSMRQINENEESRRREIVHQEKLIHKLLKTEQSSSKENYYEKEMKQPSVNRIVQKPEEIEQLLTSTQRFLESHPNSNHPSHPQFTQPFSSLQITSSHQKQLISTSNNNKKPLQLLQINSSNTQSIYKPNKDLMKLADLDTPCFQSSIHNSNPNTRRNNITSTKQIADTQLPSSNPTKDNMQKRKRISISIANLNSQPNFNR